MKTLDRALKISAIAAALMTFALPAKSHDLGNCLKVDDTNTPTVILSGRLSWNNHRQSRRFSHYIKLDTPLRADNGGGCVDFDEIIIFANETDAWPPQWDEKHVTIEGRLNQFPFGSIFLELTKILDAPE